jgi:hypothetical protein
VARLQCKRLFVLPVHWRSLCGQKRFNVAAPARPESWQVGAAAPGMPLIRAVRRLPARSLSDAPKMRSAALGVQIMFSFGAGSQPWRLALEQASSGDDPRNEKAGLTSEAIRPKSVDSTCVVGSLNAWETRYGGRGEGRCLL